MYSIPRGNDEYQHLVSPRAGQSVPADFYQNSDEVVVNYGTVNAQPVQTHSTEMRTKHV